MKLLSAIAWVIILPVTYLHTWENPSGVAGTIKSRLRLDNSGSHPSLYILAVMIYLGPNMLAATLFLFPHIRSALERSNIRVITFMMWWSQVLFYLAVLFKLLNTELIPGMLKCKTFSTYSLAYWLAEECMKADTPF
jgi:callose synthase